LVTKPEAIENFLNARTITPLRVKGRDPNWLLDYIQKVGGIEPNFKTTPRPYQLEAIPFALQSKGCLLFYDLQLGKTKIGLDWLAYLFSVKWISRALIIAHAPIGVDVWCGQIPTHSDLNICPIRSSPNAFAEFCDALESDHQAILLTWPTLQNMFTIKKKMRKKERMKLYPNHEMLREVAPFFDALIIDEIHRAMRFDGLYFQIAAEISTNCQWCLGLTGTPFGRDPSGLWAEAFLTDKGKTLSTSYHFFLEAFGKEVYNYAIKRYETVFDKDKLPILQAKLEHMMLPYTREEVQTTNILTGLVKLPMSKSQKDAYNDAIDNFIKDGDFDDITATTNIFVRLRQIASGFLPFIDTEGNTRTIDFDDATKYEWLEDFVSQLDKRLKCIIFHEFTHTGQRICDILTRAKVFHDWLHGGVRNRPTIIGGFQTGSTQILVSNTATGGTGITLSRADYLCFFESPTSVIVRQQAAARPMARGDRLLVIDDIICAPVEEKILGFHQEGKELLAEFRRSPRQFLDSVKIT